MSESTERMLPYSASKRLIFDDYRKHYDLSAELTEQRDSLRATCEGLARDNEQYQHQLTALQDDLATAQTALSAYAATVKVTTLVISQIARATTWELRDISFSQTESGDTVGITTWDDGTWHFEVDPARRIVTMKRTGKMDECNAIIDDTGLTSQGLVMLHGYIHLADMPSVVRKLTASERHQRELFPNRMEPSPSLDRLKELFEFDFESNPLLRRDKPSAIKDISDYFNDILEGKECDPAINGYEY